MKKALKFRHNTKYDEDTLYFLKYFTNHLRYLRYTLVSDVEVSYAYSEEPVPFEDIPTLTFKPIKLGEVWSEKNFACAWFRVQCKLPADIDRTGLCLEFNNEGEALLVDSEGHAIKGFTSGSPVFGAVDYQVEKRFCPIGDFVDENGNIDVYIDGAANSLFGEFSGTAKLAGAYIVRENPEMMEIFYDYEVLLDYATKEAWGKGRKEQIIDGLRQIRNLITYNDPDAYKKAKIITNACLGLKGKNKTKVTAIGHSHLDLAWLWPIRETKRKARRTFTNALYLLRKYPDFYFVVSQPQQLEWVKEIDPKLYGELLQYMKEGRIEAAGGGWVENDTNLPCEESLVRQELYGQKFWQEELGHYVNIRWLPDTFGYTACLPQVLRLSEQDSFMTIKISWSNRTQFPFHSFHWQGIDGSKVFVHMPPEGDYNSRANPSALMKAQEMLRPVDSKEDFLMLYGIGDGGGGPSELMVESCIRESKIAWLPKVEMNTAQSYFDTLKKKKLPTYEGEMYLEKHRGTYTSESNTKNFNRQFEGEILSYETLLACMGEQGDKQKIDVLWKEGLLYQFHDILPGSSIARVYAETEVSYKRMLEELERMANALGVSYTPDKDKGLVNLTGKSVTKLEKSGEDYLYYKGEEALVKPIVYSQATEEAAPETLETDCYSIAMAKDGSFETIRLKKGGKTVVTDANKLRVFIDTGDAWDFQDDYREQPEQYMNLDSSKMRSFGDLVEIVQQYSYKNSKLTQTLLIHKKEPIIRVSHDWDWKDTGYMVRAEFIPTAWNKTVYSDIQFGYLGRPTTDDTEHNAAQFEICCQKWFDLANDEMGFGIINNAKCGYMAKKGIVSLNLLRSTNYPCENSEQKPIHYEYALYPHLGGFNSVKIDDLAKDFNLRALYGNEAFSAPKTSNEQAEITAFKPAYDGNGFILRLFERTGKACQTELLLPEGYQAVCEVNLLEDEMGAVEKTISLKPFQIRSFRIIKA